jgi:hypothetical protein
MIGNSVWRCGATRSGTAVAVALLLAALAANAASANDSVATLWLDGESYVAYGDSERVELPEGSSIRFHLGRPAADGSIPIAVVPEGVSLAPIPVAEGAAIEYSLAEPAVGTLRVGAGGAEIELLARLVATLRGRPEVAPVTYELRFTTGRAEARSTSSGDAASVEGMPAQPTNALRLVAVAANPADAFPGPGQVVRAVLSGRFDRLPVLP